MEVDIESIGRQAEAALKQLLQLAELQPGQMVVIGCSTSEVVGAQIGSAGSEAVAAAIFAGLHQVCTDAQVHLVIQCCEHLNRALVLERCVMEHYRLDEVTVRPVPHAGGALAARAIQAFDDPVVVEAVSAHAGLDIGNTLIGMHLRCVAVPVRLDQKQVGQAAVIAARTRPKLVGGGRAVYE